MLIAINVVLLSYQVRVYVSSPADVYPPFKSSPFTSLDGSVLTRFLPSNQTLAVFPCGRSSLSRSRSVFFQSQLWRRRADVPAATTGKVKRLEEGAEVRAGRLIAARIHFLILEHFLDLSGVRGDSGAHGLSCSQLERSLCVPSL